MWHEASRRIRLWGCTGTSMRPAEPTCSVVSSDRCLARRYGNVDPFPITYASRPRLRSRLTLGGQAWPRNPWVFGGQDSRLSNRYLRQHSHFQALDDSLRCRFSEPGTLSYRFTCVKPAASADGFSPVVSSARSHSTSELLRFLSRVAASKLTSWLSRRLHILVHLAIIWGP